MGMDGFVWFVGVVEDRNDPSKLGRVRVRCLGYPTADKTLIPTEDLPWAHVMHPVTDPSMQGMGNTPSFLVEGSWVMGFFMDADMKQQPMIMGSLPGVQDIAGDSTKGFYDPNSIYPQNPNTKSGHDLNESDTNRLARNDVVDGSDIENLANPDDTDAGLLLGAAKKQHTMLADKATDQANYTYIPVAGSSPFAQPTSAYEAEYPKNHVYDSESGHLRA